MIKFSSTVNPEVDTNKIQKILAEIQQDSMGGWYDLPENYDRTEFERIKQTATKIQSDSKYLVCIGVGGSYLGHRALIDALSPKSNTKIIYAGNSLNPRSMQAILTTIGDHDFSVNVISKSGTTTEPAIAFRIFKEKLKEKYGDKFNERVYATTSSSKGALYDESVKEKYTQFVIPDNIGGRYSVLSAVGLLPLATAGVDIDDLMFGAQTERSALEKARFSDDPEESLSESAPVNYAVSRATLALYSEGPDTEIFATFEPHFQMFTEWWKQLFGESEGKQQQGIFPASVVYTTDLHSLGQFLQDGRRNIFETVLKFDNDRRQEDDLTNITIPNLPEDLDGLGYLEGRSLSDLNQKALEATILSHRDGGIPVFELVVPDQTAHSLGALIFFFEVSCAISAKLFGVNPFDQPGVESYKTNMFKLFGKPGY